MFSQIKYFALLVGVLATSVYAAKKPAKDDRVRVVYTVRYWDRAMAPDQKKEWCFFAENESEISDKYEEIIVQLKSRAEEVKNLLQTVGRPTDDFYFPIGRIRYAMNYLRNSNEKGIVYGYDHDGGFHGLLSNSAHYFPTCSLDDEEKSLAKKIKDETNIFLNLREDGSIRHHVGKILNWAEYGSYAGFQEKISTLSTEKKEESYDNLVKHNIYNILCFKVDFEKDWVLFNSKDNAEKEVAVLSGPSGKKNIDKNTKNFKIKKTRNFHRDSAIEVK